MSNAETKRPLEDILGLSPNNEPMQRRSLEDILGITKAEDSMDQQPAPQSVQPQSNTPEITAPEHSYQETIPTSSILGGEQKREGVFAESLDKQMQKEHLSKMSTDPAYRDDYFRGLGYQDAEDYRKRTADKLEETLKGISASLPERLIAPRGGIETIQTGADEQFSRFSPDDKSTLRNISKVRQAIKTLRSNNFWSGLAEGFDPKDIATLGFAQVGDNVAAINALNKAHRGEQLNDMEKALVDAWKLGQQVEGEIALLGGRSLASNIGRGVGESLPFVTEMIATGGAAAAATKGISKAIAKNALKTSAKELLEEGSQQVAKKLSKDRIVSGLQKGGLKLAESAVGSAVRVPLSGGVYKNYTGKRLDQFIADDGEIKKYVTPAWKDALKAGFETFAEYQSEDVGNWIGAPINSLGSRFAHSGFGKMLRLDQIADYKGNAGIEWLRDQAKITNLVGETLGEAYGDALINTFEKDKDGWRQMLTKEYWWQLAGVSSILPLATSIPNVLSSGQIDYSRRVAELEKIKTNALSAIKNSDLRTQLTKAAAAPTIAQRSEILKGINWKDTAISKADGFNAVKYINATTAFDISEGEASETERLARFFPVATYLEEREYMGLDGKEPTNDVVEIADKKGNVYTVQSGDIDSEDPNTILKAKDGQGRLWDIPLGDVASTSRGSIRDKVAEAYAMMFGTQAKQQSLDKLQSKINEAVAVGVSNEDIHNIIEENGLTQFENGDLITLVDGRQGEIIDFDKGRSLISTIDQNGEVLLDSYGINDIVQPEMTAADVAMQKAEPTAEVAATTQPAVKPIPTPEQQAIEGVIVEAERVIDEQIDSATNVADGNIYNCILEDDSEVVIRNGNIVLTENGEIDAAKSDSTIVVEYPDGRKQTISPQRIAYIASAENAQQAKENAHEQLRNVVTEQERLTNINMAINNGDPVVTTDGRQGVVSATKDGTLTLTDTEGNTSAITFEDIADVAAPTEEVAETAPEAVEPEVAPTTEVTAEAPVNEPAVSDKAAEIPEVEIPRLKNGEVDYNSIDNAELFSSLLVQDLGSKEDALEAVKTSIDGYSAEYAKLNEETKKEKDITKRVAKTKESAAIARRLEVLNQAQEILSPKPEVAASEPTVSASATPEVAPTPEEVVEPTDPKDTYRNRIAEWVNKLGINVRVLESVEEVELSSAKAVIEQGQRVVGWYNVTTGEVCLYMPNIDSIADVDSTIVHEVVAHKGMAIMLGNDGFNALCDRVWDMMSEEARSAYINYPGVGGDTRKAADEYIAHLAERVDLDANEQTIWQEIVNFFREALAKIGFEINITDEVLADLIRASYHNLAAQNLQKQGAEVDTTRGDVLYAVKDVLTGKDREQAIADLMKVTGRSRKTVEQYLKAEESLAQIILNEDNVAFLDLQVDESVPSIWNNSDYPQGTVEFSNICRKRLPLTMIYQRLQKEFPNTVFDATTLETIRGVLKNNGIDVACGLCFVEDRRQLLGEIGQEFIDAVRGEHITTNANQIAALAALKDSGDNYIPNLYELLTLDGMKELRRDHPEVAAAFVRYNNARGMQAGRLFQAYSAYHREILDYSAAKVKSINDNGGLRIFSFSDFEAHHLIDLVQVLTDCAAKGIKVQGYTKVPEFARAVKDTKMKLNRSLIAKGSGVVDENYTPKEGEAISPNVINGKRLLLDTVEGIDVNNVDFFDSTSSSSVGNILVGINDEQIRLAMEDPFVDYIIPFHTGIKRETLIQKGIGEWVNYKNDQVEKVVDANGKLKKADKHINIYTDVLSDKTRTERQFVNKYLKICRERGYIPKFPQFLNKNSKGEYIYTKGYYKFLLDFKMFDKKGYILPQEVVVPIFDNDLNKRILEEYVEGERTAAPNEEVYNEVKEALELDNVRFRFIGEKGASNLDKAEEATIRLDNLSIARDMESDGKDAKAIKMATGWERGADDKWRYEETDTITAKTIRGLKGAGANKIREARSKRISDLDKYAYITNIVGIDRLYDDKKINATSWPDAQKKVWLDIYNIYKDNRDAAIEDYRKARKQATTLINLGKGEFMLYEVLGENDSLFKAYPQLRNVKLMIKPYKGGKTLGGYNRLNNTIEIVDFRGVFENDKGEGSASTAVHEIQHIIQGIEGFARGGNALMEDPNKARNKASAIERMTENRDKSERELESLYSARNGISDKMKEWYDAHPDAMYEDALKDPVMAKLDEEYSALGYAITTAQDNLTFFAERLASLENFDTKLGDEGYRKLAGEVEARNVERRRQMTPEERRQTLASETADVAKEDQIVLEDLLIGVSAKDVRFSVKGQVADILNEYDEDGEIYSTIRDVADGVEEIIYNNEDSEDVSQLREILNAYRYAQETSREWGDRMDSGGDEEFEEALRSFINSSIPSYSDVMFSIKEMDVPYLDAVKRGDMKTARRMVNEAAEMAGYTTDESWKKNHRAPRKGEDNVNPFNTEELVPEDYWTHPEWYTQIRHNSTDRESYYNMKSAIDKYKRLVAEGKQEEADKVTVTMYRGVDRTANKKESKFRNGDWITPSREYALLSAPYGKARVISQDVLLKDIWWDGNSINEWGYDDGSEYTYKDTKNNRKLLDAVTYDDNGNIIPLSERFNPRKEDIRYSVKSAPVFYSNAENAVRNIKQEKATPEQWLKMIEKNGGLKAGEDKWLGLSDWLKTSEKKTLTKDEVLEYISQNQIQIEEVKYSEFGPGLIDEAANKLTRELQEIGIDGLREKYPDFDDYFEVDGNEVLWSENTASEGEYEDYIITNQILNVNPKDNAINERRLSYTTAGLRNKQEIALVTPNIEPWGTSDEIHFGDAGEGRAVAWMRFGETTDTVGNRVLVIDEIQSKRHQEGRDRGYISKEEMVKIEAIRKQKDEFSKMRRDWDYRTGQAWRQFQSGEITEQEYNRLWDTQFDIEKKHLDEIERSINTEVDVYDTFTKIPSAPFEKNWAELAMKRMLRYAAENGYDKVAWTTGEQQAERYNLGAVMTGLKAYKTYSGEYYVMPYNNGAIGEFTKEYTEKELADTFGKELATNIITNAENATEENPYEIEGENLRFGGSGMKTFYDTMLVNFMNKYGKKWGVKVGEVTMPELEENNTMHSVDVTDAMRESVMQGQLMFSIKSTPAAAVMDQQRTEFEKLTEEYDSLLQNRDNNPNFESALNEWRDRKAVVLYDYLNAYADSLGLADHVTLDIFNTQGDRSGYDPIVDIWMPGLSEAERQEAIDALANPKVMAINISNTRGILVDVSHKDDVELDQYATDFIHEFTHIENYAMRMYDLLAVYEESKDWIENTKLMHPYIEAKKPAHKLADELLAIAMEYIHKRGAFDAFMGGYISAEEAVDTLKYSKPLMRELIIKKLKRHKQYEQNGVSQGNEPGGIRQVVSQSNQRDIRYSGGRRRRDLTIDYAEQEANGRRAANGISSYNPNQPGWNDGEILYSAGRDRRDLEDEQFVEVDLQDLIDRGEPFEILVPENTRFSIKEVRPSVHTLPIAEHMERELKKAGVAPDEIAKRIKKETGWSRNDKGNWSYKVSKNPSWNANVAPIDVVETQDGATKTKSSLQLARERVSELYHELRNSRKSINEIIETLSKEIRGSISTELVEVMGKRDFDNIVRIIEEAVAKGDIEQALRQLEAQLLKLEESSLRNAYNKMMNLKLEGTNPRGVSVSRWVDQTARVSINTYKEALAKGMRADELDKEFHDEWQFGKGEKFREPFAMFTAIELLQHHDDVQRYEAEIAAIDEEIAELRQQNSELFYQGRKASENGNREEAQKYYRGIKINKEIIADQLVERLGIAEKRNASMRMLTNALNETIMYGRSAFAEMRARRELEKAEIVNMGFKDCVNWDKPTPSQDEEISDAKQFGRDVLEFLISPAYSMNSALKYISINAPGGEGALYNHFVKSKRGYIAAQAQFYTEYNKVINEYSEKAKEIFGEDYDKVVSNSDADSTIKVTIINGKRTEDILLTYGEAMYLYMADKMSDGRVKIRKMGISEEDMNALVANIPQQYIQFADWIQGEFLPSLREKYNQTHLECFGIPMSEVDNYVPLKVLKSKTYQEVDGSSRDSATLPSAITGSIIKRTRNTLPIDLHTNALEVVRQHIEDMEHWNAYTFVIQDMNALLSSTEFRRMIDHLHPGMHKKLKDLAQVAAGTYSSEATAIDKGFAALNKVAATSKIAFRINTALKQVLSYPAFYAYAVDAKYWKQLTRNLSPDVWKENFEWAINNCPSFKARWESRSAGNEKLSQATMAQFDKIVKKINNVGMFPNAFVDAMTCANGAKAVYDYKLEYYKERGLENAEAERLALLDAATSLNETQQSSEGLYLSTLQSRRDFFSISLSTFQNSNFAYLRKQLEAIVELRRDRDKEIANRVKYYEEQGMESSKAEELAIKDVKDAKMKAGAELIMFSVMLNMMWTLGGKVWQYLFGDDDDREEIPMEALKAFALSPIRNTVIGSTLESIAGGYGASQALFFTDLQRTIQDIQRAAQNDPKSWDQSAFSISLEILATNGLGVDLATFYNIYQGVAGMIRDGVHVEDVMNILNAPQSQAKLLAGKPKEGESLEEYQKRMAFIYKRTNDPTKKDLARWEREFIAGQQRKLLLENGYSSVDMEKSNKRYNEIRKVMGITRSGNLNEDARYEFKHHDPEEQELIRELLRNTRIINAKQKQLERMVDFNDSYLQLMLDIESLRKEVIETYDKSNK